MTLIEAAKLALEHGEFPQGSGIIRELRQAIAEAEQYKPYAYAYMGVNYDGTLHGPHLIWEREHMDAMSASRGAEAVPMYMHPPKREPLTDDDGPINDGWQITVAHGHSGYGVYAHMEDYPEEGAVLVQAIEQPKPPAGTCTTTITTYASKREWQGLTLEQKHQLNDALNLQGRFPIIEAIEAAIKENNT